MDDPKRKTGADRNILSLLYSKIRKIMIKWINLAGVFISSEYMPDFLRMAG